MCEEWIHVYSVQVLLCVELSPSFLIWSKHPWNCGGAGLMSWLSVGLVSSSPSLSTCCNSDKTQMFLSAGSWGISFFFLHVVHQTRPFFKKRKPWIFISGQSLCGGSRSTQRERHRRQTRGGIPVLGRIDLQLLQPVIPYLLLSLRLDQVSWMSWVLNVYCGGLNSCRGSPCW